MRGRNDHPAYVHLPGEKARNAELKNIATQGVGHRSAGPHHYGNRKSEANAEQIYDAIQRVKDWTTYEVK